MIKISYDKEGDILEIRFSDEQVRESEYMKKQDLLWIMIKMVI